MWLLSLSVHLVGIVGYNLLLRRSLLRNIDRWLLATILQTGIGIPALFIAIFFPFKLPTYSALELLLFVAAILLTILFHSFNVKSLQYLQAGVFSLVYNTRFITVTILGVLVLSEKLTLLQFLGGLFIFCSVFLVHRKGKGAVGKRGLFYGFGTAFIIGFLNTIEKILIQSVGYFEYFVPAAIISTIIMWVVVFIRRTKIAWPFLIKSSTVTLMGLRAMSAYGFSYALVFGPVALSNYVSSLSVVLTVLFGALFFHERDQLRAKIFATIIAFLGLTLILLGKV